MTKYVFLAGLRLSLSDLPRAELDERISFYEEMINDRIEDGASEAQAIDEIGSIKDISAQIRKDISGDGTNSRVNRRRALYLTLIIIGSPLWISLAAVALGIGVSLAAVLFSVIISLWATTLALAVAAPAGLIFGVIRAFSSPFTGLMLICCALFSAGLAILFYLGCRELTKKTVKLVKYIITSFKR